MVCEELGLGGLEGTEEHGEGHEQVHGAVVCHEEVEEHALQHDGHGGEPNDPGWNA